MVFDRVLPTAPRLGCDEDMLVMNNYKSSESDSNGLSRYAEILWFNGGSKYFNFMCYYAMFLFVFYLQVYEYSKPNHPWVDHLFCDLFTVAKFVLTSKWKTGNLQAVVNHSSLLRNNHYRTGEWICWSIVQVKSGHFCLCWVGLSHFLN